MDLLQTLFEPALLPFTIPLLLALALWGLAVAGLFDFEAFDFDLDLAGEADLDLEADTAGGGLLQLLGLGTVPLSLVLTLVLFGFGLSGLGIHLLFDAELTALGWSAGAANLLAVPGALVLGVGFAAGLSRLLGPVFQTEGRAHGARDMVGQLAVVKTGSISPTFGSVTVKVDGEPIELSARTETEANGLHYGDQVLVIEYDAERGTYLVEPVEDILKETPIKRR